MADRKAAKIRVEDPEGFGVVTRAMMRFRYRGDDGKVRKLSPAARDVYAVLWSSMIVEGECPSISDIMELSGSASRQTVMDALMELRRADWIQVEEQGQGRKHGYVLRQNVPPAIQEILPVPPGSKAPKPKPEKKEDPLTRAFSGWWKEAFPKKFPGKPYRFEGEKDWSACQAIIAFFRAANPGEEDVRILRSIQSGVTEVWNNKGNAADRFILQNMKTIAGFNMVLNRVEMRVTVPEEKVLFAGGLTEEEYARKFPSSYRRIKSEQKAG